jgi:soluble lytic murein transglycosylase-like protein
MYNVSPALLWGIAKQESGLDPAAPVNYNTDGTYDVGLMRINSSWAAELGKSRWARLGDPCANVMTGAWILSQCISQYGNTWAGVGCYHSRTPSRRDAYAKKIVNHLLAAKLLATKAP